MDRGGIAGLKMRVGRECSISRGGPDCAVDVYRREELEEKVTALQVGTQLGGSSRSESCQGPGLG